MKYRSSLYSGSVPTLYLKIDHSVMPYRFTPCFPYFSYFTSESLSRENSLSSLNCSINPSTANTTTSFLFSQIPSFLSLLVN
uniref:Variable copy number DNA (pRB301) n=1 Tax=Oryza sativa TaxID=4530 RepID=Q40745_ORYSA|nr:unnamed protein product [Oryza sativa Japonica Group]